MIIINFFFNMLLSMEGNLVPPRLNRTGQGQNPLVINLDQIKRIQARQLQTEQNQQNRVEVTRMPYVQHARNIHNQQRNRLNNGANNPQNLQNQMGNQNVIHELEQMPQVTNQNWPRNNVFQSQVPNATENMNYQIDDDENGVDPEWTNGYGEVSGSRKDGNIERNFIDLDNVSEYDNDKTYMTQQYDSENRKFFEEDNRSVNGTEGDGE